MSSRLSVLLLLAGLFSASASASCFSLSLLDLSCPGAPQDFDAESLFIDPVNSTRDQAAFTTGPTLTYNRMTGDVSIFAPPILGPADEFGQRDEFGVESITLTVGAFGGDAPAIPQVTTYTRQTDAFIDQPSEPAPSFQEAEAGSFQVQVDPTSYRIARLGFGWNGAEVDFGGAFLPQLTSEVFEPSAPETQLGTGLIENGFFPSLVTLTPNNPIGATIQYRSIANPFVINFLTSRPQLQATVVVVPEPASFGIVSLALLAVTCRRLRRVTA